MIPYQPTYAFAKEPELVESERAALVNACLQYPVSAWTIGPENHIYVWATFEDRAHGWYDLGALANPRAVPSYAPELVMSMPGSG